MQRRISPAELAPPVRVTIVTLDSHLAGAVARAQRRLRIDLPGIELSLHAVAEWSENEAAAERCRRAIESADIVVATMLFMEDHIQRVLPWLAARRDHCDAMICCMSAAEVVKLTRAGRLAMDGKQSGPMALLAKLRGKAKQNGAPSSAGAAQMRMLRRLPRLLRFIPGTAQDLRAYFLTLQYWLAGSDDNVVNLVRYLVDRYADGERRALRGTLTAEAPREYPDVGLYHPRATDRIVESVGEVPRGRATRGTVGVLVMRSYVLAGNSAHYDGVIAALEARGLAVLPAFASGLDARPAIEKYFQREGKPTIDALVSLTGFSLVGGPAYNDAHAAETVLAQLDVPYVAAQPVEFQTLEEWERSERGLMPVEATIMLAIPELDGATGSLVFGGRSSASSERDMQVHTERAAALAARVDRLVALRAAARAERKVAIVLFNFPPNGGSVGTAAHLSVFASLRNALAGLREAGYTVDLPESVDALRERLIGGNTGRFGTSANVHHRIPVDEHVRRERYLRDIEAAWGPAPGKQQSDGASLFVLGERFGNVFVGVQPAFGYEGDPMRLLFERGFAPTHAFSAFYRWLREDFGAHAVLHFGTHGALEFMPGKQAGLSAACWPDRLIGDLPNFYLYAANNPSEGTIAKRRSAATLLSYLTPPVAHAGLYRGLAELKRTLERWRALPPEAQRERAQLVPVIHAQAVAVDLAEPEPAWPEAIDAALHERIERLMAALAEFEATLIPHGLHVIGVPPSHDERTDLLIASADAADAIALPREAASAIAAGASVERAMAAAPALADDERTRGLLARLVETNRLLAQDHELAAIVRALDARFIAPSPSGDLLRTPAILPTGRNIHGFDPFRLPSAHAMREGARDAARVLERHARDGNRLPESIALVLWGTDNLKTEGAPIGQMLALIGARARFDGYGRLAGAQLVPLAELGRPRIDVVVTLSGIFRDLLPLQTKLLAEAAWLAASADEPIEHNFVRKHALEYQAKHGCDLETAALRVFSNADGAYGSNVNHLIDSGRWDDEDELAEAFSRRKCFAYSRHGKPARQAELFKNILGAVELTYQNLDSLELGVTTVDHYFDTLGGISRAVRRANGGEAVPVYIGDQTRAEGTVRTLAEQVALETRTRVLNPQWYEALLEHGYEGVRQIEAHVTNTMGWSATTGQVAPWVYRQLTQTFVLDRAMRDRLATLNPAACAKVANRLLEAHERRYWQADPTTLAELNAAGEELEDRLEGITERVAA